MQKPKIRTRYDEQTPVGVCFSGEKTRTKQEFRDEVDINHIVKRYMKTGVPLPIPTKSPQFGDFSTGFDYLTIQNRIAEVKSVFANLPADVRRDFGNDPSQMLDWIADPANVEEAQALGLLPVEPHSSSLDVTVPSDTGASRGVTSRNSTQERKEESGGTPDVGVSDAPSP